MKFSDIPQMSRPGYSCDVSLDALHHSITRYQNSRLSPLNLEPDFQRMHVWTPDQQTRYVEFILRGGNSSKDLYFNCPGWMGSYKGPKGPFELVDGKQRLEACLGFLDGRVPVFGGLHFEDFEGNCSAVTLKFHINSLPTRGEVLQWYLDLNEGGVVHTTEELDGVKALLEAEG